VFVTSGAASLAYDIDGESDASTDLLLIHAGVTDRRSWRLLIDAVGSGRRIVAYDQRHYGETVYEPEVHARHDDALAVMDAAGMQRPVVIGASMGGRDAIDLALEHPDRVRALVLIGPAVSGAPDFGPYSDEIESFWKLVEVAEEGGDLEEVNRLEAHAWLDGVGAPEGRVGGEARSLFLEMNARAIANQDDGDEPRCVDAWSRLEEISVPTLVLLGTLDMPEIAIRSRAIADRVEGARLVELEGAAHLPHLEGDPACFAAIEEFLDTLATA
jgi:pimeloyl-ACP methyl ester carboxylesterase